MTANPIQFSHDEHDQRETVIPVLREDWELHKELRETGTVRVQKIVHEHEELIQDSLASETVEVVRVPINQVVTSAPPTRTEGDVTIIPVVQEFAVVVKELRVIEEIRITRTRAAKTFQQPVLVRAEEVTVERVPAGSAVLSTTNDPGVLTFVERREEAVLTKNARVVEEVSIAIESSERVQTVRDTVRHTEVDIEKFDEEGLPRTSAAGGL